jgi:hypothetical protein
VIGDFQHVVLVDILMLARALDSSQVETCERPSNWPAVRQTSRNTWLTRSSAAVVSRSIRSTKR